MSRAWRRTARKFADNCHPFHCLETSVEQLEGISRAKGEVIDSGWEEVRLPDLIAFVSLASLRRGDQLVQIVVEHPLLQYHSIDPAAHQLVHLSLLLGHLLIVGILVGHGGELAPRMILAR